MNIYKSILFGRLLLGIFRPRAICAPVIIAVTAACLVAVSLIDIGQIASCYAEGVPEENNTGLRSLNLNDSKVRQSFVDLPIITLHTTQDLLYKNAQSYQGYEIAAFVNWFAKRASIDPSVAVITFIASDGYRLTVKAKDLINTKRVGALAFRVLNTKQEISFPEATQGRLTFNPGPFVLVWEGEFSDSDHLPRPWSVVELEVAEPGVPQAYIPHGSSSPEILKGLGIFREQCSKCHSINKVGGSLGPELNVPKNVTEYWSHDNLQEFIKEPRSFRWGSRMPSFAWLGAEQIQAVIQYLRAMKGNKVCSSSEKC